MCKTFPLPYNYTMKRTEQVDQLNPQYVLCATAKCGGKILLLLSFGLLTF